MGWGVDEELWGKKWGLTREREEIKMRVGDQKRKKSKEERIGGDSQ